MNLYIVLVPVQLTTLHQITCMLLYASTPHGQSKVVCPEFLCICFKAIFGNGRDEIDLVFKISHYIPEKIILCTCLSE